MNITGRITGLTYKQTSSEELKHVDVNDFDINNVAAYCLLKDKQQTFGISKWVSPKRTRSYPYERVYNTLHTTKKITVIPVVKDEGLKGDRDFIQWDTVSLMSLLDVFVIFGYYVSAEKSGEKITKQKFDNEYIMSKIDEIKNYHSSALHWNLNELKSSLNSVIDKVQESYKEIQDYTGVRLHDPKGLIRFKEKIGKDVLDFMNFSREKSEQAQLREFVTVQPKENLQTLTKAKITINNYLGGQYFFTVDEVKLAEESVYLIEGKHSKNTKLPSKGDVKDGLIKMLLYCNLTDVKVNGHGMKPKAILMLTSEKMKGHINSDSPSGDIEKFILLNGFSQKQKIYIEGIFEEARTNKFTILLRNSS